MKLDVAYVLKSTSCNEIGFRCFVENVGTDALCIANVLSVGILNPELYFGVEVDSVQSRLEKEFLSWEGLGFLLFRGVRQYSPVCVTPYYTTVLPLHHHCVRQR